MGLFKKKIKENLNEPHNFNLIIDSYSDDIKQNETSNDFVQLTTENSSPKQSIKSSEVLFKKSPTSSKKTTKKEKPKKKGSKKVKVINDRHVENLDDKPFELNMKHISLENLPLRRPSTVSINLLTLNENLTKVDFDKEDAPLKVFNTEKINNCALENSDETSSSDEFIKMRDRKKNVLKGKPAYKSVKFRQQRQRNNSILYQKNRIEKVSVARQSKRGIRQQASRSIKSAKTRTPNNRAQRIIRPVPTRFTPIHNQWLSETNLHKVRKSSVSRSVLSLPDSYEQDHGRELQINETDKKEFKITIDVQCFSTDEIIIALKDGRLIINAKHFFKTEFGFEFYQMHRSYPLPRGVQKSELFTKISKDGVLEIKCIPET
ncbi:uncharacterized protein LOC124810926 isoform X1 [Hydra vulgaris]|uniref:uncharacterized protein LOC124810926 isoform X1 n=1 Tax=Hydra vulgaris TaxID=6087 RepID=UPI001F5E5150|nr:uncharacterized protein LOC124810926 [Hydra vulgaris]